MHSLEDHHYILGQISTETRSLLRSGSAVFENRVWRIGDRNINPLVKAMLDIEALQKNPHHEKRGEILTSYVREARRLAEDPEIVQLLPSGWVIRTPGAPSHNIDGMLYTAELVERELLQIPVHSITLKSGKLPMLRL